MTFEIFCALCMYIFCVWVNDCVCVYVFFLLYIVNWFFVLIDLLGRRFTSTKLLLLYFFFFSDLRARIYFVIQNYNNVVHSHTILFCYFCWYFRLVLLYLFYLHALSFFLNTTHTLTYTIVSFYFFYFSHSRFNCVRARAVWTLIIKFQCVW